MKGRFFGHNDFWKERQFDEHQDTLEKAVRRILFVFIGLIVASFALTFFCGCKVWKKSVKEEKDTSDSVRIEYIEKIVKVPVTVYVEVPVEQKEKFTKDSTSILETTFAVSEASMVWIGGVPFLRHTLANKPQKIEKSDSVPVVEKEKVMWKTRRVTYNKTEIREKQLAWWQKGLMWAGGIALAALVIFLVIFITRYFLKR